MVLGCFSTGLRGEDMKSFFDNVMTGLTFQIGNNVQLSNSYTKYVIVGSKVVTFKGFYNDNNTELPDRTNLSVISLSSNF